MKRKTFASAIISIAIVSICVNLIAFEWPQEEVTHESFSSVFGQLRNGIFNTSIVFSDPAEIKPCIKGNVVAVVGKNSGEMGWFESPLGNAVILAHEDELLSVYANLETVDIPKGLTYISADDVIGTSGSSGWQHGQSSLEFQIIDIQKHSVINPRLLLPKLENDPKVHSYGITMVNRKGEEYDLRTRRSLPAGAYMVYRTREQNFMPYSTTVSVNGAAVETITFDMLGRTDTKLTVSGKKTYNVKDIYPNNTKQFLAEVTLSQGKNTLNISTKNINGEETSLTYILDIR